MIGARSTAAGMRRFYVRQCLVWLLTSEMTAQKKRCIPCVSLVG